MHGSKPEKLVHPANEYLQDEKGHHLSAVNSPCGGLFEFLALKGLHRVAQGQQRATLGITEPQISCNTLKGLHKKSIQY
jgi:hypothetical protein